MKYLTLVLIALSTPSFAWESQDKIGVEAKAQEARQYAWVKEHTRKNEKIFIYNYRDSISDREFQVAVNKLGEKYTGK